ncbi:MAG: hypothetical protein DHS20C06_07880 [Hyphobacterium sp.]|nr:MAG: hypothetical protein DHS20C06_07880 [Hyphobacterium sp.]
MAELTRETASTAVRVQIRSLITSGKFAAGDRLDEARLAKTFGVSRTPLREALASLERDGLVERQPYKGCTVVDIDEKKLAQIYPVIGTLEGLALRTIKNYPASMIAKLEKLNLQMASKTLTPRNRYKLDRKWHETLVSPCTNSFLIDELQRLLSLSARFDAGKERGLAKVERSTRQHAVIAQALLDADPIHAAKLIEDHRAEGVEIIAEWRRARL